MVIFSCSLHLLSLFCCLLLPNTVYIYSCKGVPNYEQECATCIAHLIIFHFITLIFGED
jgi:hypothetical protein